MNDQNSIHRLAAAAQGLRAVRRAYSQFLTLWALERIVQEKRILDRVATDVERARIERRLADPFNRDWSLLYRGSILDD
jgi:uncharacterized protein YhaN